MFWIALAAQLAAPEPTQIWFSRQDMPVEQLSPGEQARLLLRISTDTDGSLLRCEVEESSGKPALDSYACNVARKRARFKPARWIDGSPVHGVYRVPIAWGAKSAALTEGDLELTVNQLPPGVQSPAAVRVMFAVDVTGEPSDCVVAKGADRVLGPIACAELLKVYSATPAKDEAGNIVSSVQDALVVFVAGQRPKH